MIDDDDRRPRDIVVLPTGQYVTPTALKVPCSSS